MNSASMMPDFDVEVVVDAHGRDPGGGGDAPDRQGVGALGFEDVGRGLEQRSLHARTGGPGPRLFRHVRTLLKNIVL